MLERSAIPSNPCSQGRNIHTGGKETRPPKTYFISSLTVGNTVIELDTGQTASQQYEIRCFTRG